MDQGSFWFADRAYSFAKIEAHVEAFFALVTAERFRL